jgi:hypothetical protein
MTRHVLFVGVVLRQWVMFCGVAQLHCDVWLEHMKIDSEEV